MGWRQRRRDASTSQGWPVTTRSWDRRMGRSFPRLSGGTGPADIWISDFQPLCDISVPPTPAGRPGVPREKGESLSVPTWWHFPRKVVPACSLIPGVPGRCEPICLLFTRKLQVDRLRQVSLSQEMRLSDVLPNFCWRPLHPGSSRQGLKGGARVSGSSWSPFLQTGSTLLHLTHLALFHLRLLRHLRWSGIHL